jgi:leader peptidase (prepilin peptidase)/N-methyltransferase
MTFITGEPLAFVVIASITGLAVGSFLNVVIYRLPVMLERHWRSECEAAGFAKPDVTQRDRFNLVIPRSRCPHCDQPIRFRENIPVLSYVLLKGRCSRCGAGISLRYPFVEILSAVLTAITAVRFGASPAGLSAIVLLWALIALSFIDFDHQILPDSIVLPMMWLGLLLNTQELFTTLQSSVFGAIAGYASLWLVYQVFKLATGKEGMGYGDFKLFALFGAWLGWQQLPLIILLS